MTMCIHFDCDLLLFNVLYCIDWLSQGMMCEYLADGLCWLALKKLQCACIFWNTSPRKHNGFSCYTQKYWVWITNEKVFILFVTIQTLRALSVRFSDLPRVAVFLTWHNILAKIFGSCYLKCYGSFLLMMAIVYIFNVVFSLLANKEISYCNGSALRIVWNMRTSVKGMCVLC